MEGSSKVRECGSRVKLQLVLRALMIARAGCCCGGVSFCRVALIIIGMGFGDADFEVMGCE